MRIGYLTMNSAAGIRPDDLARELESRGFESLWVPEHSHIPTDRQSPYPGGGELPTGYYHMMDPIVSLTAAAGATSTLQLGTAICLLLEHDLLNLAVETATLDVIADGRFILGVGVGWNREELANHRPDIPFSKRYSALAERIEALRTIWADEKPEFHGTWDVFTESWVHPKPARGTIPIAMGNMGPTGMRLAARHADQWCPIDSMIPLGDNGKPDIAGAIATFRQLVDEAGRDPADVSITILSFSRPKRERIHRFAELGVERVILTAPTAELIDADDTLRQLDEIAPIIDEWTLTAAT